MKSVYLTHHHVISPLGYGSEENFDSLVANESGIRMHRHEDGSTFMAGMIDRISIEARFEQQWDSESFTFLEKMMILALDEVLKMSQLKIGSRTGLILATTKGNIDLLKKENSSSVLAERVYLPSMAKKIASHFNFINEPVVLSNACVSGNLALGIAQRSIRNGMYDEVLVVSGDLVSEFVLAGFNSFQAISERACKPYSRNRDGISIGEAVACALVTSDRSVTNKDSVQILSCASANDANHISGPSRTGEGLYLSVKAALREAGKRPEDLDYISAHGTATIFNDEMESIAFERMGLSTVPLNSLKGYYGHTLGSAGLLESIMAIKSVNRNQLISSWGFDEIGVSGKINIISNNQAAELNTFIKTSSGFGGCNATVVFEKSI